MAASLAHRPDELKRIRSTLARHRDHGPLFDMPAYARHLEDACREMVRRPRQGLPPDHLGAARQAR